MVQGEGEKTPEEAAATPSAPYIPCLWHKSLA